MPDQVDDAVRALGARLDDQAALIDVLVRRLDAEARTASRQAVRIERLEDELWRLSPGLAESRARSGSRAAGRHRASSARPA